MAYEFKKLSDVNVIESTNENAHVLVEQDGEIVRIPAGSVGGGLPEVTTNDAGKLMRVQDDGTWAADDYLNKLIEDKLANINARLGLTANATEWTLSNQTTYDFSEIVYDNNVWVAVANNSKSEGSIFYSLDGKSWVDVSVVGYVTGLCYGNGLFVICTNSGALYYSEDGKTWTSLDLTLKAQQLSYENGVFHAYHPYDYSGVSCLHYSIDGKTWTSVENVTIGVVNLKYANGVWVASTYGSHGAYYSTDGMTWIESNITSENLSNVCYANGTWLAAGDGDLYSSSDGMTWTMVEGHPFVIASDTSIFGIINFNSKWIIATQRDGLYYTEDFTEWNKATSDMNEPRSMYAANGICICVDNKSHKIYYSVDGVKWLPSNLTNHSIGAVHYANRLWVLGAGALFTTGLYYSIG